MDRHDRAAHRRPALSGLARTTAFVCTAAAFVTGVSCASAANPPSATSGPAYVDSSRAGVLEFLDVTMHGPRGNVEIDRYVQDFSYCSGVVHRVDARAGDVRGHVIMMHGGGTVRIDGRHASVDEPGSRGVHHFRALSDPQERASLVRTFFEREKRLRGSIHYPVQLAAASTRCKK